MAAGSDDTDRAMTIADRMPTMKEQIVLAARAVFLREGYKASTEAIIREAGIARQSLYNHFPGKKALIKAVIEYVTWETMRPLLTLDLPADMPLPDALRRFGESYMEGMLNPENLALTRLISSAAIEYPEYGQIAYQSVRSIPLLAAFLRAQAEAGRIDCPAPDLIAESFFGALVGPARFRYLLGMNVTTTQAEQRAYVREIVELYVRGLCYAG